MPAPVGATVPRPGAWVRPVQPGPVVAPFDPPPRDWLPGHRGVDLASEVGATIRSPAGGTVTFSGAVAGRGVVVVTHPGGLRSSFEPVGDALASGTPVAAGDALGRVSATAGHCAPATCLHWGVRSGETYIDALALLARARIILLGRRLRRARRRPESRAGAPSPPCASARSATP